MAGGKKQRVSYFFPCAVIKLMTTESFPSIKKVKPVTVADKEKQGVSYFFPSTVLNLRTVESFPSIKKVKPVTVAGGESDVLRIFCSQLLAKE